MDVEVGHYGLEEVVQCLVAAGADLNKANDGDSLLS